MKVLFLGPPTSDLVDFMRNQGDEVLITEEKLELAEIERLKPDFLVSFGYRHIIRKEVIDLFPRRIINLHISLLPWNRGADPNFWSIVEDTPKGVTIHYIDEGVDTGDVIVQKEVNFGSSESLRTSYDILHAEISQLFKVYWPSIRDESCIFFPQAGPSTTHKAKDKDQYQYLLEKLGYDTPISKLRKTTSRKRISEKFDRAYIRCDSSAQIGGGHVTRCLALAEILKEKKIRVEFICKNLPANLSPVIKKSGYKVHLIPANLDSSKDAQATLKFVKKGYTNLVIVDNYSLDFVWEKTVSERFHLVTIDDLAVRKHSCHMLVNPNMLVRSDLRWTTDPMRETVFLLGPQYAILRREFRRLPKVVSKLSQRDRVVVFFGSFDETGETLKLIRSVVETKVHLKFDVIVSRSNVFLKEIKSVQLPPNIRLHIQPASVSRLLRKARLFFGSGGSITSERLACGLPGVIVAIADNQVSLSKNLADRGCQIYLGLASQVNYVDALRTTETLYRDEAKLNEMRLKGSEIFSPLRFEDLNRVVRSVWIRPARIEDARFLFDLRKDPAVASASIQQNQFSFKSHMEWMRARLARAGTQLFIVMYGGKACGQVRIDEDLTISISLSEEVRGKGISRRALQLSLKADAASRDSRHPEYIALIRPQNRTSVNLFRSLGFKKIGRIEIHQSEFLNFTRARDLISPKMLE